MKEATILRAGRPNAQTKTYEPKKGTAITTSTNPAIAGSFYGPNQPRAR
jgi:hypothetical protein